MALQAVNCQQQSLRPLSALHQGFVGRALGDPGLKPSVRVGEAAMREVAAFLLDHEHFARVPHTVMVKVSSPTNGPRKVKAGLQSGCDVIQLPLLIREEIAGRNRTIYCHY